MYEAFEKLQQKAPNPKEVNPYVWGFPNKPYYVNNLNPANYYQNNGRNYYNNDPILLNAIYLAQ
jgi:hypothetical protein